MNSPCVAPALSLSAALAPAAHPAVLQPRQSESQPAKLKAELHQALHQAPAVIVDLIWLDAIDTDTIVVFKNALHLAAQLGKSIAFHGANRELAILLMQEQDRLRSANLGSWEPQPDPGFQHFLRDRAHWYTEAATVPDGEIVFPRFGLSVSRTA